ncbi:putative spermidine/putrescine transport system permease protein [Hypnocyclicus thermotrophus]|uniref:Spermidine/putrescine transport system permease protein n=2 Tax=Hypnocyclicus thermotrophus TaxID=1627895 RepID=A0AA46E1P3_9FUSO|nr:putative spermidine/putrescine transport system permease protein [Hypnocyclicus thermotrophus]
MLQKIKPYIKILPAFLTIFLLFWYGIFLGVLQSFGFFLINKKSKFTFENYIKVFRNREFLDSLFLSIKISLLSVGFVILFAIIILYLLFLLKLKYFKLSDKLQKLYLVPMLVPYLIGSYISIITLAQTGFLSKIFYKAGVILNFEEFPILINDSHGIGIILTYIWKTLPFVLLMTYPILDKIIDKWIKVGKLYGANNFKFFIYIIIPLLIPTLFNSAFILLAFIFSAFEIPYMLGLTYPKMLSVMTYDMHSKDFINTQSEVMSINIIIVLITISLGIISYKILKKNYEEI